MNSKFNCKTCESADKKLELFIADLSMETSHHRMEGQSVKCGFGLQGICCRLCSNGPCRITPKGPKGVCGATAHHRRPEFSQSGFGRFRLLHPHRGKHRTAAEKNRTDRRPAQRETGADQAGRYF